MQTIRVVDRKTGKLFTEKVYGESALRWLYQPRSFRFLSRILLFLVSHFPWVSQLYGYLQSCSFTKRKIQPFIDLYQVDSSEFADPVSSYRSFNDFFIRRLHSKARPLDPHPQSCIIPADGRYLFYQDLDRNTDFLVKGAKLDVFQLLGDRELAESFLGGSCLLGRLCPTDYHRYHFPCDCIPGTPRIINGPLYSVNPIALRHNLSILWQNKRCLTPLQTETMGELLFIEIGATNVGTICNTFQPGKPYLKGDEKGFFSFGGSAVMVFFPPKKCFFDKDLIHLSQGHTEVYCQMGQSLGKTK